MGFFNFRIREPLVPIFWRKKKNQRIIGIGYFKNVTKLVVYHERIGKKIMGTKMSFWKFQVLANQIFMPKPFYLAYVGGK